MPYLYWPWFTYNCCSCTHTLFHRPVVAMEYMGEEYFKLKATVIKYERFLLKVLE